MSGTTGRGSEDRARNGVPRLSGVSGVVPVASLKFAVANRQRTHPDVERPSVVHREPRGDHQRSSVAHREESGRAGGAGAFKSSESRLACHNPYFFLTMMHPTTTLPVGMRSYSICMPG
jgi:hypothetical protein